MKKLVLAFSFFAISTLSFANSGCFPVYLTCGAGTTYCPDDMEMLEEDLVYIEKHFCG